MSVSTHKAMEKGLFLVDRVMREKFNEELHALFNVPDQTIASPLPPFSDDGLWLPGIGRHLIQNGPTAGQVAQVANVQAYTGPAGTTEDSIFNSQTVNLYEMFEGGTSVQGKLLFATTIVISYAPQKPFYWPYPETEPNAIAREDSEVMTFRAARYLGALKHTISKWVGLRPEARASYFVTDYSSAGEVILSAAPDASDAQTRLLGIAHLEYYIQQDQMLPNQQRLPDLP